MMTARADSSSRALASAASSASISGMLSALTGARSSISSTMPFETVVRTSSGLMPHLLLLCCRLSLHQPLRKLAAASMSSRPWWLRGGRPKRLAVFTEMLYITTKFGVLYDPIFNQRSLPQVRRHYCRGAAQACYHHPAQQASPRAAEHRRLPPAHGQGRHAQGGPIGNNA